MRLLLQADAAREDLSGLIDAYLTAHPLPQRDRALLTELVYGVFRRLGYLDWQIDRLSRVKTIKRPIRAILRLGLYQLLFLDRVPDHAAVHTSVGLAKSSGGAGAGRFVNGLLRCCARNKGALPLPSRADPASYLAVTTSHPAWMIRRWLARWGEEKAALLARRNNEIPPLTLRVNRLKTTRSALAADLEAAGGRTEETACSPDGLYLKGLSLRTAAPFFGGRCYVQDEAAQLIAYLVDPRPGERILDLCAAPGGKATHLAERTGGKALVTAADSDPVRLEMMRGNIRRLQTPGIQVETADAALRPGRRYDRILVDAPCSGLGILRRIPEGKWRRRPERIAAYAERQRMLLERAVQHVKAGGRLVYATCSTEYEENEAVADAFSRAHPEMRLEDPAGSLPAPAGRYVTADGYFTTRFNSDKMDQFFAAKWIKQS